MLFRSLFLVFVVFFIKTSDTMAVSFEQMNPPLAILCALGGVAVLLGIITAFCRKEMTNRGIFYSLSFIILVKTVVVEILRIKEYLIL